MLQVVEEIHFWAKSTKLKPFSTLWFHILDFIKRSAQVSNDAFKLLFVGIDFTVKTNHSFSLIIPYYKKKLKNILNSFSIFQFLENPSWIFQLTSIWSFFKNLMNFESGPPHPRAGPRTRFQSNTRNLQ